MSEYEKQDVTIELTRGKITINKQMINEAEELIDDLIEHRIGLQNCLEADIDDEKRMEENVKKLNEIFPNSLFWCNYDECSKNDHIYDLKRHIRKLRKYTSWATAQLIELNDMFDYEWEKQYGDD